MRIFLALISLSLSSCLFAQTENQLNINSAEPVTNPAVVNTPTESVVEIDSTAQEIIMDTEEKNSRFGNKRDKRKEPKRKLSTAKKEVEAMPASPASMEEAEKLEEEVLDELQIEESDAAVGGSVNLNAQGSAIPAIRSSEAYSTKSKGFSSTIDRSNMQRKQRSPSFEQQVEMDAAVNYFEVNDPTSFEYNYFKYTAGNYDVSLYDNLEVAEAARPNNADVHVEMAGYYMIKEEKDSALVYLNKLVEAERLTENVVEYGGEVLRSVPEEGVLITHGFDDSYGAYLAQNQNNVRSDIKLMSLDFMQSEFYRQSLVEEGFILPDSKIIDVDFLNDFCALNANKKISIALTTPKEYFKPMRGKLFIVGLVFEYHEGRFDNFYSNDYLWNEEFEKGLIDNPGDEKGKQLSANYLPMLLYLRKVYDQKGETEKRDEVDRVTDHIGMQSNKYEQVQKVKASY